MKVMLITLSILKLCSSNTILNNTIDSANGNSMTQGNYGPILPFTHTTFTPLKI